MIGITGGIGSGKSTIAKALAQRGFTVYDCDEEAKRIIAEDKDVQTAIIDLLGPDTFIQGDGDRLIYNTAYVAQRVFSAPELLAQLNAIVHPAVAQDIKNRLSLQGNGALDFVESAILFEAGLDALCDKIIVVDAPIEVRIARTINRDYNGQATIENINKVRARIEAQATHAGDLILLNDGNSTISDLVEKITHWM